MCAHAEMNLVALAEHSLRGATVYTTLFPCLACGVLLVTAGIVRLVYASEYADARAMILFRQAGVVVERLG